VPGTDSGIEDYAAFHEASPSPAVRDGCVPQKDGAWWRDTRETCANWDTFVDPESPISHYDLAISTAPCGWASVANVSVNGSTTFLPVMDHRRRLTPPDETALLDAAERNETWIFVTPDILPFVRVAAPGPTAEFGLARIDAQLPINTTLFSCIRGTTFAQRFAIGTSNSFRVDPTAPVFALPPDGASEPSAVALVAGPLDASQVLLSDNNAVGGIPGAAAQANNTVFSAAFVPAFDPESGIDFCEVAFGSAPGMIDICGPVPVNAGVGGVVTCVADGPTFTPPPDGTVVHALVRCENNAGAGTLATSVGCVVDTSPPRLLIVSDGVAFDVDVISEQDRVSAHFDARPLPRVPEENPPPPRDNPVLLAMPTHLAIRLGVVTQGRDCEHVRFLNIPPGDARAHLARKPPVSSGTFVLAPSGTARNDTAVEVVCDMDLNGGGWELAAGVSNSGLRGESAATAFADALRDQGHGIPFSSGGDWMSRDVLGGHAPWMRHPITRRALPFRGASFGSIPTADMMVVSTDPTAGVQYVETYGTCLRGRTLADFANTVLSITFDASYKPAMGFQNRRVVSGNQIRSHWCPARNLGKPKFMWPEGNSEPTSITESGRVYFGDHWGANSAFLSVSPDGTNGPPTGLGTWDSEQSELSNCVCFSLFFFFFFFFSRRLHSNFRSVVIFFLLKRIKFDKLKFCPLSTNPNIHPFPTASRAIAVGGPGICDSQSDPHCAQTFAHGALIHTRKRLPHLAYLRRRLGSAEASHGASEPHSAILRYEASLVHAANESHVSGWGGWVDLGMQTSVTLTCPAATTCSRLETQTRYAVAIRATNVLGLSAVSVSDGFTVDPARPTPSWTGHDCTGNVETACRQTIGTVHCVNPVAQVHVGWGDWSLVMDEYEVGWCQVPGEDCASSFASQSARSNAVYRHSIDARALPDRTILYATVRGRTTTGVWNEAISSGVLIARSPIAVPAAGDFGLTVTAGRSDANGTMLVLGTGREENAIPETARYVVVWDTQSADAVALTHVEITAEYTLAAALAMSSSSSSSSSNATSSLIHKHEESFLRFGESPATALNRSVSRSGLPIKWITFGDKITVDHLGDRQEGRATFGLPSLGGTGLHGVVLRAKLNFSKCIGPGEIVETNGVMIDQTAPTSGVIGILPSIAAAQASAARSNDPEDDSFTFADHWVEHSRELSLSSARGSSGVTFTNETSLLCLSWDGLWGLWWIIFFYTYG
jgi:hypothetical protein